MAIKIWTNVVKLVLLGNCILSQENRCDYTSFACTSKPPNSWPDNSDRTILGNWLVFGSWDLNSTLTYNRDCEYPGYDGWYNNLAQPDLGAVDRPLLRRWPAAYEDGSYAPSGSDRPNPLELSEKLLKGNSGTFSNNGRNALLVFFGQQVVEEILDSQRPACPPEYFNIKIPLNHSFGKPHSEMPFLRTRYDQRTGYSPNNPRQQLNEITPYIDGGLFYGTTKQWSDDLRKYKNGTIDPDGKLAYSEGGLFPEYNTNSLPMANPPPPFKHGHYVETHETEKVSRFFKLGNPRGNENAFLLTFGIVWFRWHNYLAEIIRKRNPDWSSDKVFNEARKWTIATQQNIYVYEWLPIWINHTLPAYAGYNPSVDPQIDQFFQAAAFRFGHTLVVPGVYLRDYIRNNCTKKFESWGKNTIRTCNIFWRPQEPILTRDTKNNFIDIDRILMGMSVQLSEAEDHKIVEDLRENVFGPLEFPRRDLMALNIQRGRDHGLPDYNTARKAYGLNHMTFSQFNVSDEIKRKLQLLYKNDMKIDPWVGGILETCNNGPGPLFQKVILDQFTRIRDGDRFWFENLHNQLFTAEECSRIKDIKFYDVLMAVTKMDKADIPSNPFKVALKTQDETLISKCNLDAHNDTKEYYYLPIVTSAVLNEPCVAGGVYDYFQNSEISFIGTFASIGVYIIAGILCLCILMTLKARRRKELILEINRKTTEAYKHRHTIRFPIFFAQEWIEKKQPTRQVITMFNADQKHIIVNDLKGSLLRALDFKNTKTPTLKKYSVHSKHVCAIRTTQNYDLVLIFETDFLLKSFEKELEKFISTCNITRETYLNVTWNNLQSIAITKSKRQKQVEAFFRVVFAQTFKIGHSSKEILSVDQSQSSEVFHTELTLIEFADSLNMQSSNKFVKKIFEMVDKDDNGFISFREFVDFMILFVNGPEKQKAEFLFNMYDVQNIGELSHSEFVDMIKSFLDSVGGQVDSKAINHIVRLIISETGRKSKDFLTLDDFIRIIEKDLDKLGNFKLKFSNLNTEDRWTHLANSRNTIQDLYGSIHDINTRIRGRQDIPNNAHKSILIDEDQSNLLQNITSEEKRSKGILKRFAQTIEFKSKIVFWMTFFTLILWAIFLERAYNYSFEREHSGLRKIAGYGVTVTRGAASAMMFSYSALLVTMCRNTITHLRDSFVRHYFPFDSMVDFHKYIACWAFFFTVLHIVGHAFNFYHISTQPSDDLTCLFRNYFHATHEIPKFHHWCYQTTTGITGIILTLIWIIMFAFAHNSVRLRLYNWFWYTHNLYPLFFIFMILHGTGRMIQPPITFYFFWGPLIVFTIDILLSVSRKHVKIAVIEAAILPSNVTMLKFQKPNNFTYKSGQWVRIASVKSNTSEYHPFTLSSAPDDDYLSVHIRTVGPWTSHIRSVYSRCLETKEKLPPVFLDGPYGEGHQDWNLYDVTILIGGGIGVTPFASILQDVANLLQKPRISCKQVYFIWVSRNQKQFEWLIDIIREVESKDPNNFVSCHIFITQFYEKFDLRTILLYVCERYYQRVSNKSLFTSLRAVTHFGRPRFDSFFQTVRSIHKNTVRFGVFSCGPPSMTSSVDKACSSINSQSNCYFEHHYKNF